MHNLLNLRLICEKKVSEEKGMILTLQTSAIFSPPQINIFLAKLLWKSFDKKDMKKSLMEKCLT